MPNKNNNWIAVEDLSLHIIEAFKDSSVSDTLVKALMVPLTGVISKILTAQVGDKLDRIQSQIREKDLVIGALQDKLEILEARCDDLEQYSRRESVRIFGVPESNIDLEGAILETANRQMALSPPLTKEDISRCHRVGPKSIQSSKRAILVKFTNYRVRARVMSAKKTLKGTNIFVTEYLTKNRASLAFKAREAKRAKNIYDTWTYDGKIIIKTLEGKIVEIKNTLELNKLTERPV